MSALLPVLDDMDRALKEFEKDNNVDYTGFKLIHNKFYDTLVSNGLSKIEHGMSDIIEDVFDEIQKSNMSKLGADGKPIYREDGKVMKGPNYFKPNFSKFFS
mgnify:CR=1 FL=1